MSLLRLVSVTKYVGARRLFGPVSVSIEPGDRIGLIGRNGTGKSTLLRILAGSEEPDGGEVVRAARMRLGYLGQEAGFQEKGSAYDIVLRRLSHLTEWAAELRELESRMREMTDPEALDRLMERYAALSERFEREGGYEMDARVRTVLLGLGLQEEQLYRELATLSGGERERVALAALLVTEPELLVLDEPTNHLDMAGVEWLEQYLKGYKGAVLVVSHDRAFLDAVTHRTWELDEHEGLLVYRGSYSAAQAQRAERLARQWKAYEAQQEEIARLEAFVEKYRAGNRAVQARSRAKRLERLERIDRPRLEEPALRLEIPLSAARGSREVLRAEGVGHRYDGRWVLQGVNLTVTRGERIAIVGPNGSGKTTLLRLLAGRMTPAEGSVYFGRDIEIGFYSQHFEGLDDERTVIDEVLEVRHMTAPEARSYLACFLFRGDDVFKRVGVLSGGERRRLMLAKLLLSPANVLCLDEPTNHLDISSREMLEEALLDYPGTLLFISHDRYFIDRLAQRLIVLERDPFGYEVFDGGYSAWREAQAAREAARAASQRIDAARRTSARSPEGERRRMARKAADALKRVEERIEALEEEKASLEAALADASLYADGEEVRRVTRRYEEVQALLEEAYHEWDAYAALVEGG